jgi:3-hydroxy-9,10-secoandrosta-1,3,5(10)-triene-9,17-dione monooxygenase reductase component
VSNQDPSPLDPLALRRAFGHFPTGVTVVTAAPHGEPVGMTVGSFFSVSLDPPLVGICADKSSTTWPRIAPANCFAVNLLAEDQAAVSSHFAGRDENKFEGVNWRPSGTGSPLLDEVIGWVDCVTEQTVESGDHWIVIGRVVGIEIERQADPLVFFRGGYGSFRTID